MKKALVVFLLPFLLYAQNSEHNLLSLKAEVSDLPIEEMQFQQMETPAKKSAIQAIFYSLLLPGMGELYAGSYGSGKYFTAADGVFWTSLIGFNIYGNWKEDDYKAYAVSKAGANPNGDEDYYAHIGQFINVRDYNHEQEMNREFIDRYDVQTHAWDWKSNEARQEYRQAWKSSEQAYTNVRFAVAALVINRIASAINAARLVGKHNASLEQEPKVSWNVSYEKNPADVYQFNLNFRAGL